MKILIDTNAYVAFCKGQDRAIKPLREAEQIYLPFVALAELRAGFLCGNIAQKNEKNLTRFLSSSRVEVLLADEQTTHLYARLFFQLRRAGTPIPTNDIWIAALAVQHNLFLLSYDSDFERLPQILRIGGGKD